MHQDGYFDANVASTYDEDHGATDPAHITLVVDRILELAQGGDILEFAIGTGRIALPLAESGASVSGIELSRSMVAELRKKERGDPLNVVIGDMTIASVEGQFSLVVLVFNTIDNLVTQEAQIACFQNAAQHLEPCGRFLIETQVPPIRSLPAAGDRVLFSRGPDHTGYDTFDLATQQYSSHHRWQTKKGVRELSIPFRYVWPSELDLMARLAGMTLEYRWGDWDRSAFTGSSSKHVSVWRKAHK